MISQPPNNRLSLNRDHIHKPLTIRIVRTGKRKILPDENAKLITKAEERFIFVIADAPMQAYSHWQVSVVIEGVHNHRLCANRAASNAASS